jgi:hypothetical protein
MPNPGMMMMAGMMNPMKPPMMPMEMCPPTKPADGSACKGHVMCTFGSLACGCMGEAWSCGTKDMTPAEDGGAM